MHTRKAIGATRGVTGFVSLKTRDTVFSTKPAKAADMLPAELFASETQALLNSTTNVIECATGGHGRCVDRVCRCHCHRLRAPISAKRY